MFDFLFSFTVVKKLLAFFGTLFLNIPILIGHGEEPSLYHSQKEISSRLTNLRSISVYGCDDV